MKKPVVLAAAILLVLAFLAACGATPAPKTIVENVVVEQTKSVESERVMAPEKVQEDAARPTAESVPAAAPTPGSSGLTTPPKAQAERMIIKNAEMDLLVADTDAALDSVTLIAADYGGYIISSHTWFEGEYKFATVRMGVPVVEFENILRRLRGLAVKVLSEVASGEDVTDQFVDLQSRLTNLQATRDRIREFLEKAETVEEALLVNEQLSQVEAQIEEIQGRRNYLRDRAAYSTVSIQLNPERPTPTPTLTPTPTPTPTPVAWRPGKTVRNATNTLTSILKGVADLLIWVVIVLGPFLIPALIVWLVVWWRRRQAHKASVSRRPAPEPPPEADS